MSGGHTSTSTDAGFSRATISVQIAYIDYYLSAPAELSHDRQFTSALLKSSSRLGSTKVPVVRIFGATPAGQKCCVHLHGVLPCFYVPLPVSVADSEVDKFASDLQASLERGLAASLQGGPPAADGEDPNRLRSDHHIYDVSPVRKRGLYGYERDARTFLKVSAFNPAFIGRLAAMCASGLLPNTGGGLQPFESHIPFVLQVLVELNLVGMGYLNLSSCKFRHPLSEREGTPEALLSRRVQERVFSCGLDETRPDLFWGFSVPRRSTSELELDVFVADVLNTDSLVRIDANTGGEPTERAVNTLRVIWEEERLRRNDEVPRPVPAPPRKVVPGAHLSDETNHKRLLELLRRDSAQAPVLSKPEGGPKRSENAADSAGLPSQQVVDRRKRQALDAMEAEVAAELVATTLSGRDDVQRELAQNSPLAELDSTLIDWLGRNAAEEAGHGPGRDDDGDERPQPDGGNGRFLPELDRESSQDLRLEDVELAEDPLQDGASLWGDILECTQQHLPPPREGGREGAAGREEEEEDDNDVDTIPQLDGVGQERDPRRDTDKGAARERRRADGFGGSLQRSPRSSSHAPRREAGTHRTRKEQYAPLPIDGDGQRRERTKKRRRRAERESSSTAAGTSSVVDKIVDSTVKPRRRRRAASYGPLLIASVDQEDDATIPPALAPVRTPEASDLPAGGTDAARAPRRAVATVAARDGRRREEDDPRGLLREASTSVAQVERVRPRKRSHTRRRAAQERAERDSATERRGLDDLATAKGRDDALRVRRSSERDEVQLSEAPGLGPVRRDGPRSARVEKGMPSTVQDSESPEPFVPETPFPPRSLPSRGGPPAARAPGFAVAGEAQDALIVLSSNAEDSAETNCDEISTAPFEEEDDDLKPSRPREGTTTRGLRTSASTLLEDAAEGADEIATQSASSEPQPPSERDRDKPPANSASGDTVDDESPPPPLQSPPAEELPAALQASTERRDTEGTQTRELEAQALETAARRAELPIASAKPLAVENAATPSARVLHQVGAAPAAAGEPLRVQEAHEEQPVGLGAAPPVLRSGLVSSRGKEPSEERASLDCSTVLASTCLESGGASLEPGSRGDDDAAAASTELLQTTRPEVEELEAGDVVPAPPRHGGDVPRHRRPRTASATDGAFSPLALEAETACESGVVAWTPKTPPPSQSELKRTAVAWGLPPVVHPTPFYGDAADVPSRPKVYGGVLFRIPHRGPSALPPAEGLVQGAPSPSRAEEHTARVLTPARRPPKLHEMRTLVESRRGQAGAAAAVRRTKIDSAGREVVYEERIEPDPYAGGGATGERTQSTLSQSSKQEVAVVAARPTRPARLTAVCRPDGADSDDDDGSEEGEMTNSDADGLGEEDLYPALVASTVGDPVDPERPASPKYDEGLFQVISKRSRHTVADSSHISGPAAAPAAPASAGAGKGTSSTEDRSRKPPPPAPPPVVTDMAEASTQAQHITTTIVEVHASSRGELRSDPRFDAVRVVALLNREDHSSRRVHPKEGGGEGGESRAREDDALYILAVGSERLCTNLAVGVGRDTQVERCEDEIELLDRVVELLHRLDPDVLVGFDAQVSSIGYLCERSFTLGQDFAERISRMPDTAKTGHRLARTVGDKREEAAEGTAEKAAGTETTTRSKVNVALDYMRRTAGGGFEITGRHVINLWRVVRSEVKLGSYTFENVAAEVLGCRIALHTAQQLNRWLANLNTAHRTLRHLVLRLQFTMGIIDALDVIGRTSELARVYGIDFMSVLTRGSQYRVEGMLIRLSHARDYLLLAATREQVYKQQAVECLPLVMEPQSRYYTDPVVVLDFQSLYPSMIIAHNLCFSTMLGSMRSVESWTQRRRMGVLQEYYPPSARNFRFRASGGRRPDSGKGKDGDGDGDEYHIFVGSNGEAFCCADVRRGVLPQLLKEILDTRVLVKTAMKEIGKQSPSGAGREGGVENRASLLRLLNARQFALKMIANVTYGYTSASYSGRMPCAGLADTIVQCARDALEKSARIVHERWAHVGARVVYGDTDSLFIQLPGATRQMAHDIGQEMADVISEEFPAPIKLQMEKVYYPCMLVTKKRYVGYSFESPDQRTPFFDAKGVETVRRDTCDAVRKILERCLRTLYETNDLSRVRRYVQRQWKRLIGGKLPLTDFIFRHEVRLGSYKPGHLPPAAIVATRAMERDPIAVPKHGERIAYVVIYSAPNSPLRDNVVSPSAVLKASRTPLRINSTYYILKQIIPALERHFHLLGVDVHAWFAEMPRSASIPRTGPPGQRLGTLYGYYASEKCPLCGELSRGGGVCKVCEQHPQGVVFIVFSRLRHAQMEVRNGDTVCMECVRWRDPTDIGCSSIDCPIYLNRCKKRQNVQELESLLESCSGGR